MKYDSLDYQNEAEFPINVFLQHQSSCSILAIAISLLCGQALLAQSIDQSVTEEFNTKTLEKVDSIVRKNFYNSVAMPTWEQSLTEHRSRIVNAKTISALDANINKALHAFKVSHTQFVTPNDETYYFLKALFESNSGKKYPVPLIDYVGAVTGGVNAEPNEVRYVLDASPAATAGVRIGDQIISVNGAPYIGQLSYKGTAGKVVHLKLRRTSAVELTVDVKPVFRNDYDAYVEAIGKSVQIKNFPEGKIGYVHVWCGSEKAHDAIEEALDKLQQTDALIFDLRDGYGGNFYNDLDYFYRPPAAYPPFTTTFRNGKKWTSNMAYDKPIVALINGGSRSGKELLAFSLKRTKRATLVGENTAGAVLAGRLFDVNDRSALYLAVAGGDIEGTVLEGKGVAPDVEIKSNLAARGAQDVQYDEAIRILRSQLSKKTP